MRENFTDIFIYIFLHWQMIEKLLCEKEIINLQL